jgi:hypothetical protein
VDPPIARNRSSQLGWITAKGKKDDEEICGHCFPQFQRYNSEGVLLLISAITDIALVL